MESRSSNATISSPGASLSKYFNYCKNIFIGKSLLKEKKNVGGQNPIEAAKLGCKIFHGPYVYNFQEVYELLCSYGITEKINKFDNIDNYTIELYMGVKCHDSEREVPRLIKILDEIKFLDNKLKIYLLKQNKTSDSGFEKDKNITNTPTIIFYKNSIEINRIVEFPVETLERDIYKIINDIEYRHVYY